MKRLPYSMTNQGLQFYVPAFSTFGMLTKGETFDVEFNCYEMSMYKMKDGSQIKVDKPIVLSLRKDGYSYDQTWRRYDCQSFQGPVWAGSEPDEDRVHTAFSVREDGV